MKGLGTESASHSAASLRAGSRSDPAEACSASCSTRRPGCSAGEPARSSQPQNDYDDLTGLGTRRLLRGARAEKGCQARSAILLIRVDAAASTRDPGGDAREHGPMVGDSALRWVAKVLRECRAWGDVACRGGGGRFDGRCSVTRPFVRCRRGGLAPARPDHERARHRWSAEAISIGTAAWADERVHLSGPPRLTAIAAVRLLEDRQRGTLRSRPQLILRP